MKLTTNLATRIYINRRALHSGVLAAMSALLVWLLIGGYMLIRETGYLSDLKGKMTKLEAQQAELRGTVGGPVNAAQLQLRWKEVEYVNQLLIKDSYRWTKLLDDLEAQAFSGVVVRSIKPDFKDGTLTLTGHARELRHLRKFIDNLIEAEEFQEVYLLKQSQEVVKDRAGRERKAVAFHLSMAQGS